jgi:hypothetical protein
MLLMIVNRTAFLLGGLLSWITLPISLITNLGGGCIVSLTFGLILLPLSLIWLVFWAPLLAISWLWERVPWPLQVPLAVVGIPLASIAYAYVLMIPEPGEDESHRSKILLCQTFPFEMDLLRYRRYQAQPKRDENVPPSAAEIEVEAAMRRWSMLRRDDPAYAAAADRLDRALVATSGLDRARYTRITELLYSLGERS